MKKVTIRDVAREAGVSVTLVSFVMNAKMGKDGRLDCPVNPDTAERVLQVAKRLGYRRNNAAASLRSGRSHSIAVIVSDLANPFFAEICRNIENIAYKDVPKRIPPSCHAWSIRWSASMLKALS